MRKRLLALMATLLLTGASCSLAEASTSDINFSIPIMESGEIRFSTGMGLKEDDSSTYVNYTRSASGTTASGPYKIQALIYGRDYAGDYVDCTSRTLHGSIRPAPIVTRGTKGYITQFIYERFGETYAKIAGSKAPGQFDTGTAFGCWSADSVYESGTIYYN